MVFPSKVDWWLVAILAVVGVMLLGGAIVATVSAGSVAEAIPAWAGPVVFAGILVGLVWPTRYEVTATELVIRFGRFRSRVRLDDIRAIHRSRNPLSSPALSLDRLRLDTTAKHGFRLISPADQRGFVAAVTAGRPTIEVDDRLR